MPLKLKSFLLAATLPVLLAASASAQYIDLTFTGTITDTNSLVFTGGESVEVDFRSIALVPFSTINNSGIIIAQFDLGSMTVSIGGQSKVWPVAPIFLTELNDSFNGFTGIIDGFGSDFTGATEPRSLNLYFASRDPSVFDVNGLPTLGLPLASYTTFGPGLPTGILGDQTAVIGTVGQANFAITSYTVTAVPEPSTCALVAGAIALAIGVSSRRRARVLASMTSGAR